jgi:hypothetical protein
MAFVQKFFDFIAGRSGYRETYVSDLTHFMQEYMQKHPEEVESQKKGRAIWWDKTLEERAPAPPMRHSPRSGGNEHTFEAGGYEWSFQDDEIPPKAK